MYSPGDKLHDGLGRGSAFRKILELLEKFFVHRHYGSALLPSVKQASVVAFTVC
jgi:hypothetical protein